jgi:hypothetical protein
MSACEPVSKPSLQESGRESRKTLQGGHKSGHNLPRRKRSSSVGPAERMAPQVGLEPTTLRLTEGTEQFTPDHSRLRIT